MNPDGAGPATSFQSQTSVERSTDRPGLYRTDLSDRWSAPVLPHGGLVTAISVRAMSEELDAAHERLRTVTTVFAGQVHPGPLDIEVSVLRRGRTMSQAVATVRNVGAPAGHTSVAVFGDTREGFEFTDVDPPFVAPPESCRSFRDPPPPGAAFRHRATFWEQVEGRSAIGHPPWETWTPTTSQCANWYRFDETPRGSDGAVDPLALVALCDTMPGAVGERMGGGLPLWFGPSVDLTVHVLAPARSDWLLAQNRARHAGEGYASVEMELWDPEVGLVAYGTQLMFFSFPEGPPEPHRRRPPA